MIAEIIVDLSSMNLDKSFDYIVPKTLKVRIGSRVLVEFSGRKIDGYVINLKKTSSFNIDRLKPIVSIKDDFFSFSSEMIELARFMQKKFNLKHIEVFRLFLPSVIRSETIKPKINELVFLNPNYKLDEVIKDIRKNANKQLELITYINNNKLVNRKQLNKMFGSNNVKKFIEKDILNIKHVKQNRFTLEHIVGDTENIVMTKDQQRVFESIKLGDNKTHLIHGITGSGKTQVYMSVIEKALNAGKNAIMLVPEISLTPQVFGVFSQRFKDNIAILHSGLSRGEKFDEWKKVKEGKARVIIGARSAIFAPIDNIGAIIIDEEHDSSYYSETNPRYSTHVVAKFRSMFNSCPLILGSATPSIDSYKNAADGKYILNELKFRINKKELPEIEIVDMTNELLEGNNSIFSGPLKYKIEKCMEDDNQAILFLNRRGYSSFIRCVDCGNVPKCTDCDVSLVYHRQEKQLKCHFCNNRFKMLTHCSNCGSKNIRYGSIGTEQVVSEIKKTFPDVNIFRLDNDSTRKKNSYHSILQGFRDKPKSILIGTQMVAKGHDFPNVTLVGIIDADISLHFSDYRANERTFQLITQVAGRSGRAERAGKVILQTYTPKHYVYNYASIYNYNLFYEKELNLRKVTQFPPYSNIIRILVTGEDLNETISYVNDLYDRINVIRTKYIKDFLYYSKMKSPVKRIKNKFRYQILIRLSLKNQDEIIKCIYEEHNNNKKRGITSFVEIDPQNLS